MMIMESGLPNRMVTQSSVTMVQLNIIAMTCQNPFKTYWIAIFLKASLTYCKASLGGLPLLLRSS